MIGCWYDDVMIWCYDDMMMWWYDDMMIGWYDDMMIWWDDDMMIWWYDDMMWWWLEAIKNQKMDILVLGSNIIYEKNIGSNIICENRGWC